LTYTPERPGSDEWRVAETRAALEEVDVGDFAAANEVAALARERNGNAG